MNEPAACAVCGCTEASPCHDDLRGDCEWVGNKLCTHCAQPDVRKALALDAATGLTATAESLLLFAVQGDDAVGRRGLADAAVTIAEDLRTILQIGMATKPAILESNVFTPLLEALTVFLDGAA